MHFITMAAACLAAVTCASSAEAAGGARTTAVTECSRVESDGVRTLCHETILPIGVDALWRLVSTTEGLKRWVAPLVAIDLRVGGVWEASYREGARLGDPGNIRNRVLSYLPGRMLSIQVEAAPPGFPYPEVRDVWTVFELAPLGKDRTRLSVSMTGFRRGEGFDGLYALFHDDNAVAMEHLRAAATSGR